jgi:hypothetical protein
MSLAGNRVYDTIHIVIFYKYTTYHKLPRNENEDVPSSWTIEFSDVLIKNRWSVPDTLNLQVCVQGHFEIKCMFIKYMLGYLYFHIFIPSCRFVVEHANL